MLNLDLGLALGGGGARGAAHIGALQILQRSKIQISEVAGTSAGAVIGAMYAATLDPEWIEKRFQEFLTDNAYRNLGTDRLIEDRDPHSVFDQIAKRVKDQVVLAMSLHRRSIIKKDRLREAFDFLIPVKTFEELQIPLTVVATDLQTCAPVLYQQGDLIEAAVQSGTIPGYIEPTEFDEQLIVDGGISMPLPTAVFSDSVDFILGIDISRKGVPKLERVNIYEIMMRADLSTYLNLARQLNQKADFIIEPEVRDYRWSRFDKFDELLEAGRRAAEDSIPGLKKEIRLKSGLWNSLKHWFGR
ncbi:MAG: patatin-like phospholipase family protein [Fidelibacterota bacterium]